MPPITIIGIGFKPLDKRATETLERSAMILASKRLYDVFRGYGEFEKVAEKVRVIDNIDDTFAVIRNNYRTRSVTLLASGDPMFFGIGKRIVEAFGKDSVELFPDLSSVQAAFARIKEPWDNAFLMSLHRGPYPEKRRKLDYDTTDIPSLLQNHAAVAVLTDAEKTPIEIAEVLSSSPLTRAAGLLMYVCEKLGYREERITEGSPEAIARMAFSVPNVVIIKHIDNRR
ncbi:MAG: precorrin-6y C5,15-methyltransferase (decarboxylating) subunit CbiE [Thermodesulfovibrionales bacterium]|jgi:precorrin-6Y C5,15-methyltransferase (decarboxylating)